MIFAGLLLALSYIGGEAVQTALQIPDKITRVIQGILLFYILACDTLITYRIVSSAPAAAKQREPERWSFSSPSSPSS